jgi:hypothetical protein
VNKKYYALRYLLADLFAAAASWTLFYIFRKTIVEPHIFGYKIPLDLGHKFVLGIMIIPLFWAALYYLSGFYRDPFHKSRLNEFGQTFIFSLVGVTILFFALILDDVIVSYKNYYTSFLVLFLLQFTITSENELLRLILFWLEAVIKHLRFIQNLKILIQLPGTKSLASSRSVRERKNSLIYIYLNLDHLLN